MRYFLSALLLALSWPAHADLVLPIRINYTADFFNLASVPSQVVSSSTFTVQAIAENINTAAPSSAPLITDASGATYTMAATTLTYPGTATSSVSVWSYAVTLLADQLNTITVRSGINTLSIPVTHKTALGTVTVTNSTDLVTAAQAALVAPGATNTNIIVIDYDEPDLGTVLNNFGNGITNVRTTWLTLRPGTGRSVTIATNGTDALFRTKADWLNYDGITYGSDTSDGSTGQIYVESTHNIWLSNFTQRGKYKYTWAKITPMTAAWAAYVRWSVGDTSKIYFTDCAWDGTASNAAVAGATLARDLTFNSHRGDIVNPGTNNNVFLNAYATDIFPARNAADTDYIHNDGVQTAGTITNFSYKGLKITSPNIAADIQPFLLDRASTPNYSLLLIDTINITGASSTLNAQMAGVIANSRISNMTFTAQTQTVRQDFVDPNGAFTPTNVRVQDFSVGTVVHYPSGGGSTVWNMASCADDNDCSSEMNAVPALSGATFARMRVNQ